jgi:ribonuclease P protein subunit RPR2
MAKKLNKSLVEEIALERIENLFKLAKKEFAKHPERSKRYVELARKISTRNRARITTALKKQFCKKCSSFLVKGKNADWKIDGQLLRVKCGECGFEKSFPAKGLAKKKAEKSVIC